MAGPLIDRFVPDERSSILDFSVAHDQSAVDTPAPKKKPRQRATSLPVGTAARREVLTSHFTRLANGGELDRLEVLDLVMGLLEDAHVHEPLIFGPSAASRFAELHQASADEWLCWSRTEALRQRSA